jgi:hypothetical protein
VIEHGRSLVLLYRIGEEPVDEFEDRAALERDRVVAV